MKKCYMCKEDKPLEDFAKKTKAKDGRQSRCKSCMSKTMVAVYNRDRSEWNDKSRKQKGRKHEWVNEIKCSSGCVVCKEFDPSCLEFHHVDPATKEQDVSTMIADKVGDDRIQEEIDKCIIVCANCHRKIHAETILVITS